MVPRPGPPAPTTHLHLQNSLSWIHEKVEFFKTFFTNPVVVMPDQVTRSRPYCLSGSPASPKFSCWYSTCSSGWGRAAKVHGAAGEKPRWEQLHDGQYWDAFVFPCHYRSKARTHHQEGGRCPLPDSEFLLKVLDFSSCEESISAWQDGGEDVEDDGELGVKVAKGGSEVASLVQRLCVAGRDNVGDEQVGVVLGLSGADWQEIELDGRSSRCTRSMLGSSGAGRREIDRAGRRCRCVRYAGIERCRPGGDDGAGRSSRIAGVVPRIERNKSGHKIDRAGRSSGITRAVLGSSGVGAGKDRFFQTGCVR